MNSTLNIAKLVGVCGRIEGRKKLQKIVHILQSRGHQSDFPHQFGYLHYGPYSHEVKADIDALVGPEAALVQEEPVTSSLGFTSFVYTTTAALSKALGNQAPKWGDLANQLNQSTSQELEAISTILFLKDAGTRDGDIESRFSQLKPGLVPLFATAKSKVSALPLA